MRSIILSLAVARAMSIASAGSSAPLILGSSSATRRAILEEMGFTFEVVKPGIDEKAIRYSDPAELVIALGKAKAAALLAGPRAEDFRNKKAFLLTADQVVVCGSTILEKPESADEARQFIARYAVVPPRTVGSCVITDPLSGEQFCAVDEASVFFEPIPAETVTALIEEGEIFYCAGGLMVEHPLVQPHIVRMDGAMDSIMGLCKATVLRLLAEAVACRANDGRETA